MRNYRSDPQNVHANNVQSVCLWFNCQTWQMNNLIFHRFYICVQWYRSGNLYFLAKPWFQYCEDEFLHTTKTHLKQVDTSTGIKYLVYTSLSISYWPILCRVCSLYWSNFQIQSFLWWGYSNLYLKLFLCFLFLFYKKFNKIYQWVVCA